MRWNDFYEHTDCIQQNTSIILSLVQTTRKIVCVARDGVTHAPKISGQKVLYVVLAANTAKRAKGIVREETTKNGARAWARFRRDSGATSFIEVFQHSWPSEKPFEDVWREWVIKVSNLQQGSLNSQTIEQLTRHGQPQLENHLRLRAPMAMVRHSDTGRKISIHNQSPTVTTTNGHQRCVDRRKVPELWTPDTSKERLLVQK